MELIISYPFTTVGFTLSYTRLCEHCNGYDIMSSMLLICDAFDFLKFSNVYLKMFIVKTMSLLFGFYPPMQWQHFTSWTSDRSESVVLIRRLFMHSAWWQANQKVQNENTWEYIENVWSKSHSSVNAYSVWCVTLVPHALPWYWLNCTLAISAVAEWFDRARLQKIMNELTLPTL